MSYREYYSQDIANFQRYGTYNYQYDEVGNLIFNSSSGNFHQVFLGLPLQNFIYDTTKIIGFYDPTFTEFVTQTENVTTEEQLQEMQDELEAQKAQTEELTNELERLIEASESNTTEAEKEAARQVILELRKALGEGRVDSDFSTDFPYTPLIKPSSIAAPEETTSTPTVTPTPTPVTISSVVPVPEPTTKTLSPSVEELKAQASASAALQASASAAALATAMKNAVSQWKEENRTLRGSRKPYYSR